MQLLADALAAWIYAAQLYANVRRGEPARLLDRLLVFALIEARSAERLGLLAGGLATALAAGTPGVDAKAVALYESLAAAEQRHRDAFLDLAAQLVPTHAAARLAELAAAEATIVAGLPVRARIH